MHSVQPMPWINIPIFPPFLLEVRGYSKLYDGIGVSIWLVSTHCWYLYFSLFHWHADLPDSQRLSSETCIYKCLHKPHHIWKVLTSFVSHAFHLLDDVLQSLPYHRYPFMFPLYMVVYLGSYILVNIYSFHLWWWYSCSLNLKALIINGSTHHTDYHMLVDYSYGQYFTLWDRPEALFKNPSSFEGNGPLSYVRVTRRKQKSCRKCL